MENLMKSVHQPRRPGRPSYDFHLGAEGTNDLMLDFVVAGCSIRGALAERKRRSGQH